MPNYLANRAFFNLNEMLNFIVDETDEDMLGPFILPTDNDEYKIVVWRRYSTKNIDNITSFPANGPGRWIVLAGSTYNNGGGEETSIPELVQFLTISDLKAYTTPSTEVLYCLTETNKIPVLFVWNPTSTITESLPIFVKLNTIITGRMVIASNLIVSNALPTGTPLLSGIKYIWQQNNLANTYDSLIEYISTTTEWVIKSAKTRKNPTPPNIISISPNFEGEFFVDTNTSVLYVGLNGGWTILNNASLPPGASVVTLSNSWNDSAGLTTLFPRRNKHYTFSVPSENVIKIELTSSVDNYLYLLNSIGVIIGGDDYSGVTFGGNDAAITQSLSPGNYTIVAATYNMNESDTFDLIVTGIFTDLTLVVPPAETLNYIGINQSVNGNLIVEQTGNNEIITNTIEYVLTGIVVNQSISVVLDGSNLSDSPTLILSPGGLEGTPSVENDYIIEMQFTPTTTNYKFIIGSYSGYADGGFTLTTTSP